MNEMSKNLKKDTIKTIKIVSPLQLEYFSRPFTKEEKKINLH